MALLKLKTNTRLIFRFRIRNLMFATGLLKYFLAEIQFPDVGLRRVSCRVGVTGTAGPVLAGPLLCEVSACVLIDALSQGVAIHSTYACSLASQTLMWGERVW